MKPLKFECPQCGCAFIDEVETGVIAYNEVEVYPDGDLKHNSEEHVREKTQTHYACRGCTFRLEEATGAKSLVEWINYSCTFSIETICSKLSVTEQQALSIRAILFDLEPLQHEGDHISTARRYLSNTGFTHTGSLSDPHAVIWATSVEIDALHSVPTVHCLWYVAASDSGGSLAYHRKKEYYFWTTDDELSKMEAKWIKKNSS